MENFGKTQPALREPLVNLWQVYLSRIQVEVKTQLICVWKDSLCFLKD